MIECMKIIFIKENLLINKKNKKVVLYNKEKMRHVIISEEVYEYLKKSEKNKWIIRDFLECFEQSKDRKYIKDLIEIMIKNEIILGPICKKNRFKDIYFSITNRCNLKCKHCISSCSPKDVDYLDTSELKKVIDNLSKLKIRTLTITGGEPLVRNDFKTIIRYIKNTLEFKSLNLSTNATLITDENINFIINNFDKVDISIDGIDEETCSKVRGKGVFSKVIEVIYKFQNKGFFNISTSMTFGENNLYLCKKFRELNNTLQTIPIERYFMPKGRGLTHKNIFTNENSNLPLLIPKTINNEKKYIIESCSCNACKEQIFIDFKGDIYPCPSLLESKYLIGSIFDKDIIVCLTKNDLNGNYGYENLKKLYPFNFKECVDCEVNIFCLKCPAMVNIIKDNSEELDTWCKNMKKNIEKAIWGVGI